MKRNPLQRVDDKIISSLEKGRSLAQLTVSREEMVELVKQSRKNRTRLLLWCRIIRGRPVYFYHGVRLIIRERVVRRA